MQIGKVIGTVVATKKRRFAGRKQINDNSTIELKK